MRHESAVMFKDRMKTLRKRHQACTLIVHGLCEGSDERNAHKPKQSTRIWSGGKIGSYLELGHEPGACPGLANYFFKQSKQGEGSQFYASHSHDVLQVLDVRA